MCGRSVTATFKKLLILFFVLCSLCCTVNKQPNTQYSDFHSVKMVIDVSSLSPENKRFTYVAADSWRVHTSNKFTWAPKVFTCDSPADEEDVVSNVLYVKVFEAKSTDDWVVRWDEINYPKNLYGMTFFEGDSPCGVSIYVVFDRLMGETMKKVIIMHEIGHAMNLDHLSSERAIMSEYYTPSVLFLTKDDLYEFCKVWFC